MKHFIFSLFLIFVCTNAKASDIIDLAGEIRIPLPENWQVTGDSGQFPFQIINLEQSAELLIYKSLIAKDEKVKHNNELKSSVDFIVKDIIMSMPEAKLLSSTGEIDDNRAIFSLEFISTDTTTTGKIFHRLNGFLYGHPNGDQILFTLWGKAGAANKAILHNEILFMQENFSYYGEADKSPMTSEENIDWKSYLLILIIIVMILFIFKRYKTSNTVQFSKDSHFWRCSCGRQNHNSHDSCKRCGQKKEIKESV